MRPTSASWLSVISTQAGTGWLASASAAGASASVTGPLTCHPYFASRTAYGACDVSDRQMTVTVLPSWHTWTLTLPRHPPSEAPPWLAVLDVTPQRTQMDYYALADRTLPDSGVHWTASWLTRSGTQQVEPASGPVA